ncbi:Putative zincin peptidase [Clostridium cavendishii DSM 21758]|uniref:Putative zincin peptidase n=1 Tax=Clostridium cavendishii DSM 21758 TaxID=1121302 RepID=A0A1M6NVQ5_9CLOT|nr:DUF3267 domain-containing protein [Clostridium cavendishii]SHJ99704.1 Putative zincin peptidase [Clostridium cavendishii DSM 21758]
MSFIITKKTHILCLVIACIIVVLQMDTIIKINADIIELFQSHVVLKYYLMLLVISVINTIAHELIHGLAYKMFGGKFKIGFKGIFAYTKETTGIRLTVIEFTIVLLAPVTLISVISLFIPIVGGLIFYINLLGSTGDLLMAFWLIRADKNSLILDTDKGFDVIKNIKILK